MRRSQRSTRSFGRNFLALLVAGGALGLAQLNLDTLGMTSGTGNRALAKTAGPQFIPPPSARSFTTQAGTETRDHTAAHPQREDDPAILHGIWAVKMASALLEKGCENFAKIPDYTANMLKQERINGALGACQVIDVKIRHEPFSVYMKWNEGDRGRQLIYVDGQNDGNMLVQPGGIRGRLTGVLTLEPTGSLAMSDSRYAITKAGLLELAHTVLSYQKSDLQRGRGFTCQLFDHQKFENRDCYLYLIEYEAAEFNEIYRKSMIYVDKELSLPICVKNYTWGRDVNPEKIDEETLIEFYAYTDLKFSQELTAADFDKSNASYRMRVK